MTSLHVCRVCDYCLFGLKMGIHLKSQVWKIGVKNDFFGLKLGQYLENWMAHPHREFLGVPPPPPGHFNIWRGTFYEGG